MNSVPAIRIREANKAPIRPDAAYVLYWMTANRRLRLNFALDRALEHCRTLKRPLLVFEALRSGYQWASDRIHRFVLDGMADNAAYCAKHHIAYFPYVELKPGDGKGLLAALAADACVVVTDDFPCFFLPRMLASAAKQLTIRLEAVDSNGLLPIRATDKVFGRAVDFRRYLQHGLPSHLQHAPHAEPLLKSHVPRLTEVPVKILRLWPAATPALLSGKETLDRLPIDHSVAPSETKGGPNAALDQMHAFFKHKLSRYGELRNEPELDVASGFSPYLHFGHLSVHEVFSELSHHEKWRPEKLALRPNGSREGWWNMSPNAEGFLDELITWREVGYNFAAHRQDYDQFDSLPGWALDTLKSHTRDKRSPLYSDQQFEQAQTHDPLWNAAQTQLAREGRIHNYLRMLWGKKILQWTKSPRDAARIMIHLNNKYGLDGRNPNSYSGIFWVLGRYDRPWPPERPIFGVIRYMSSENTARKVSVDKYVRKYSPTEPAQQTLDF